jgi:HlyD family secretion protein
LQAGQSGARDAELALQQAQTQLQARRNQLSAAKTDAALLMEQRVNELTKGQSAYATALQNWQYVQDTGRDPLNVVYEQIGKKSHPKLDDKQKQQYADAYVQAEAAMHSAEAAVTQAQASGVQTAEQEVASAQAKLDALRAGGDAQQLAACSPTPLSMFRCVQSRKPSTRERSIRGGMAFCVPTSLTPHPRV